MELFNWSFELLDFFVNVWTWLNTEIFNIGGVSINLLGIFSTSIITAIITARIIALAIPT